MRLTARQHEIITQTVSRIAGEMTKIYLFGSRLNDHARGGDIDILLEPERRLSRIEQGSIKMGLEGALGLPVDIVVHIRDSEPTPFQELVRANATRLEANS